MFSQRTEEASAVQYFEVRTVVPGGAEFPGGAHLRTHLNRPEGGEEARDEVLQCF